MPAATPCDLPASALLCRHAVAGNYCDAYKLDLGLPDITLAAFVQAFYTTRLFKLERWILRGLLRRPSTDAQAVDLGLGQRDAFAAWTVEARTEDQLLLSDLYGRTRSWLMVLPGLAGTRLYFGSAVVARRGARTGERSLGWTYRALLGFHRLYSRLLLNAAARKLRRGSTPSNSAKISHQAGRNA